MVRGAPDDSNVVKQGDVFRLDDMAELAVRLGSMVRYNRDGTVMFWDDFEKGMAKWTVLTTGAGAGGIIDGSYALSGNQCVRLTPGTSSTKTASINKGVAILPRGGWGLGFAFSGQTFFYQVRFTLAVVDAGYVWYYTGYYNDHTGKLTVSVAGGTTQEIGEPGEQSYDYKLFYQVKMVTATENQEYVGVYFDDVFYPAAGIKPKTAVYPYAHSILITLEVTGDHGSDEAMYVDDVVLTQGEYIP